MEIKLSVESVLDTIYASSAMAAVTGGGDEDSPAALLTPEHADALRRLVDAAFAGVVVGIAPVLSRATMLTQGDDYTVTVDDDRCCAGVTALTSHLESAVAYATLSLVYRGHADGSISRRAAAAADGLLDDFKELAAGNRRCPGRRRMVYY